jgi:hypothetical protein
MRTFTLTFAEWMVLPALTAGFVSLASLWIVFFRSLPNTVHLTGDRELAKLSKAQDDEHESELEDQSSLSYRTKHAIEDKMTAWFGAVWMALCLIMLGVSSSYGVEMWMV